MVSLSFSKIVGNDLAKLALISTAIDPSISGLLMKGTKGIGKSTLVHSMSTILPTIEVIDKQCPFHCSLFSPKNICATCKEMIKLGNINPGSFKPSVLVLPASITEENLYADSKLAKIMGSNESSIFTRANNQYLFADEINLLNEDIITFLLNPQEFDTYRGKLTPNYVLIGAYNVEEGEVRLHLADRFGVGLELETSTEVAVRTQVIETNLIKKQSDDSLTEIQEEVIIQQKITESRDLLKNISITKREYNIAAKMTNELNLEGHRASIAIVKVARALAAYQSQKNINEADIFIASKLVLKHRFSGDDINLTDKDLAKLFEKAAKEEKKETIKHFKSIKHQVPVNKKPQSVRELLRRSPKAMTMLMLTVGIIVASLLGIKTITETSLEVTLADFINDLILVAVSGSGLAIVLHIFIKPRKQKQIVKDKNYFKSVKKSFLRLILFTHIIIPTSISILVYILLTVNNADINFSLFNSKFFIDSELVLLIIPITIILGLNTLNRQNKELDLSLLNDQNKRKKAPLQVVDFPKAVANPIMTIFFILTMPLISFFGFWWSFQKNPEIALFMGFLIFFMFIFAIILLTKQTARGWSKRGLYGLKPDDSDDEPEYFHDPYKTKSHGPNYSFEASLPENTGEFEEISMELKERISKPKIESKIKNSVKQTYYKELPNSFKAGLPLNYNITVSLTNLKNKLLGSNSSKKLIPKSKGIIKRKVSSIRMAEKGRIIGSKIPLTERINELHLVASLIEGIRSGHITKEKIVLKQSDLRETRRIARAKASIIFVLDLSASMEDAISAVRSSIESLHHVAYQHRDRVSVIACKNDGAYIVQHPTTTLTRVERAINQLGVSGLTPLASGVLRAIDIIKQEKSRDPGIIPIIVLVTDGGTCVPLKHDLATGEERVIKSDDIFSGRAVKLAVKDFIQCAMLLKKENPEIIIVKPITKPSFSSNHGFRALTLFQKVVGGKIVIPTRNGLEVLID